MAIRWRENVRVNVFFLLSNISLDDFVHHLKKLVSKDNIIDGPDNDENYEVIFEELDQSFTDQEIEICVKKTEKR